MLEKVKETAKVKLVGGLNLVESVNDYIDAHPSVIYYGLIGLSFTIGVLNADLKQDLTEIKNKLD